MAKELELLEAQDRGEWRVWLEKHHASSPGVWVVFHKARARKRSIPYDDSVREALCYGWIDSLIKRLDDDRYARKFTPRQPKSKWSDSNRKRWTELNAAGLLAAPGIAAAPTGSTYAARPKIPELPGYIAKAFKGSPKAWAFFQDLSPGQRSLFIGWIDSAKRPETREKRLRESVALLMAGEKLGLK